MSASDARTDETKEGVMIPLWAVLTILFVVAIVFMVGWLIALGD